MLYFFRETGYRQTRLYSNLLRWYVSTYQYLYTNILQIILECAFYPYLRQCYIFLNVTLVCIPWWRRRVSAETCWSNFCTDI